MMLAHLDVRGTWQQVLQNQVLTHLLEEGFGSSSPNYRLKATLVYFGALD